MSVAYSAPIVSVLVLYARFFGDAVDCILNQLFGTMLVTDRDFVA